MDEQIPPPPEISANEWQTWAVLLVPGRRLSIGWQARPEGKGGKCYLVGRDTVVADVKVIERFPATQAGWEQAWRHLISLEPSREVEMRAKLDARTTQARARAALDELEKRTQVRLQGQTFVGGYSNDVNLNQGKGYDLRFTEEDLVVTVPRSWPPVLSLPFHQIEELEIGGPGLTSSFRAGHRMVLEAGLGFMAAPVVYASTSIQTIIRVRTSDSDLYFQNDTTAPHILKIALSRQLAAIREAHAPHAETGADQAPAATSVVAELKELASMLEAGLLTREEFDQMKKRLLDG